MSWNRCCATTVCSAALAAAVALGAAPARAGELESDVARMARIGSCWSPSFSPDGEQLAFVSNLTGNPQVWVMETAGGFPRLVTALDDQVGGVAWSPDGRWLAFSLLPGGGMNEQLYLVPPEGGEPRRVTAGGKVNNWLGGWSHDGSLLALSSNSRSPAAMDAWVYDAAAGEMRLVAENPGIGELTDLSRDGRRAGIWRMASRSSSDLYVRDLESGAEHLLTPHEGPGSFGGGYFSPDGSTVYLSSNLERDLIAFGRVRLGEDGATALLVWNVAGRSELEFLDLASGERSAGPELPAEIVGGVDWSRDGGRLALVLSGSAAPSDIWLLERSSGELRRLTRSPHAGVDLARLTRPELVSFPAHDGLELSGWLYRPPGVEEPAPYVLSFHGGPEGQERPRFRGLYQALVGRGIGVFAPNVRGSAGFGKRFVNLDNGALRYDGIRDIEASVGFLVGSGIGDPKRLGIMGGSYGGYMTMAGLAWYPEMFAAGANLFGVVNFATFFANTEPWMAAISTLEYGDPETQAELLRDLSPLHRIDRVKAPTIVLHGANDTNVPVVEAEQIVDSLRERQVPVEYVLFPDEGHGFRKTENRIRSQVAIVSWFERYLKE